MKQSTDSTYLACERKSIYALLMVTAGMMGAYTFTLRGGVFCNAQTANVVLMSIAFGQRRFADAFYFLIPITAYFLGALFSELLPSPLRKFGFLRWDTYLIGFEFLVLFVIGWIPLSVPHHVVQVIINFIASMQYNTFRQAEGIPMATTFCTNHVRQVGISIAKILRKKDIPAFRRGLVHFSMILCFLGGGILLTACCDLLQEKAIWLTLIPLGISFVRLIYADLKTERGMLASKPHGH